MKRDPDLVRNVLSAIEGSDTWMAQPGTMALCGNWDTVIGHLKILEDAGYVRTERTKGGAAQGWRLTWAGHEFLDQTRDPEIWEKTKAGAAKVGSFSMPLMMELAAGFLKAKAASLGLPMM